MTGGRRPRRTGSRAEDAALAYLVEHGYFPLARNHHSREGEVDLIVGQGELVVFAEVKMRRKGSIVDPIASVTPTKQRRIVRAAQDYVRKRSLEDKAQRYDILAVTTGAGAPIIEHVEGAFDSSVAD